MQRLEGVSGRWSVCPLASSPAGAPRTARRWRSAHPMISRPSATSNASFCSRVFIFIAVATTVRSFWPLKFNFGIECVFDLLQPAELASVSNSQSWSASPSSKPMRSRVEVSHSPHIVTGSSSSPLGSPLRLVARNSALCAIRPAQFTA